ncbi:MAG: twin-arginine translocation pathway signal protein, partial [Gammaproteobacteria bacterium]|nr:twin-arginine translocation pathway signal protein [Gammaproteobacteria bacterium]
GTISNATVLSMDWLPTLLSVAGIENQDKFDGQNISGVLFNNDEPIERPVFWRYRNQLVARKGNWKYIKAAENEYLFNLKNDLAEKNNLIGTNDKKTAELKVLLQTWEAEMNTYKQQTN